MGGASMRKLDREKRERELNAHLFAQPKWDPSEGETERVKRPSRQLSTQGAPPKRFKARKSHSGAAVMAVSSILTPSQSGILGEGGRKVLKTRVQILGRFLMDPGEGFTEESAVQLMERAMSGRRVRIRTHLTVFNSGVRIGERGIFAAMPLEFIKYGRLSGMVTSPRHPSLLVICVRDYEQRCGTVIKFKDDVCLRVVFDVIDRHRRVLEDDVARLSDLQSVASDLQQSTRKVGGTGFDKSDGNWQLRPTAEASGSFNGATAAPGRQSLKSASESTLMDADGDYATIRRSRLSPATTETKADTPPTESIVINKFSDQSITPKPLPTDSMLLSDDSDYAIVRRSRVSPAPAGPKPRPPQAPQRQQLAPHKSEDVADLHQPLYQKNSHHQNYPRPQQQRYSSAIPLVEGNGGGPVLVPDMSADIEDVETAAIFETPHGPPTLLNELVRRSVVGDISYGLVSGRSSGEAEGDSRSRLMADLPPEFVAQVSVRREHGSSLSVNGARPSE